MLGSKMILTEFEVAIVREQVKNGSKIVRKAIQYGRTNKFKKKSKFSIAESRIS